MENNMKFFKVRVERGHCGAKNSLETDFYFAAQNAYDAMCMAKKMPGVKHDKMPLKVEEITEEEYVEGRKTSAYHKANQEMFKSDHQSKYKRRKR